MRSILKSPALGGRFVRIGLALAVIVLVLTAPVVFSQTAGQTAPAQQQAQAAASARMFNSDAAMILNYIKADKTADFEMVMGKVKEALAKSEKPERKQQAQNWRLFKAAEPGPSGSVLYVMIIDPPVKGADYTIYKILEEGFPGEWREIYKTFGEAFTPPSQLPINLSNVIAMK